MAGRATSWACAPRMPCSTCGRGRLPSAWPCGAWSSGGRHVARRLYRWVAAQPAGQPVLELPIGLGNKTVWAQQAEMMYYATYHWQPIVNGTGGFAPPEYDPDVALYNSFPATAALRLLRARGVRYVIVHRSWIGVHASAAI